MTILRSTCGKVECLNIDYVIHNCCTLLFSLVFGSHTPRADALGVRCTKFLVSDLYIIMYSLSNKNEINIDAYGIYGIYLSEINTKPGQRVLI